MLAKSSIMTRTSLCLGGLMWSSTKTPGLPMSHYNVVLVIDRSDREMCSQTSSNADHFCAASLKGSRITPKWNGAVELSPYSNLLWADLIVAKQNVGRRLTCNCLRAADMSDDEVEWGHWSTPPHWDLADESTISMTMPTGQVRYKHF